MAKILILYSTTDGHTLEICEYLKQVIERNGNQVTLLSMDDDPQVDMKPFDKIVLGASIRYGKHSKQVYRYIEAHEDILNSKPNAFFSVNVGIGAIDPTFLPTVGPVPADEVLQLHFAGGSKGAVGLRLIDQTGRVQRSLAARSYGAGERIVLDLADLPPGPYWLSMTSEEGEHNQPVLIR